MTEPSNASAPAPTLAPAAPEPKAGNGLGLAALIVGVVAFIFAVIPVLSFIAWLPGLVGIVLGIVGLTRKGKKKAAAGIGLGISILAIIVGIVVTVVSALFVVSQAANEVIEENEAQAAEIITVTYEVTSDQPFSVTYSSWTDETDSTVSLDDVTGPWTESFEVERGDLFDFNLYSVSATGGSATSQLACTLTIDGEVIDNSTHEGNFGIVSCSGTAPDAE